MITRWHPSLRLGIGIALVTLFLLGARILWPFLTPLALALLLTYILVPIVDRVQRNTGWSRTAATLFIYLLLLIALALVPALVGPTIVNEVQALVPTLERGIEQLGDLIADLGTPTILGQSLDPYELYQSFAGQLVSLTTSIASSSVNVVFGVATTFLSTVLWLLFILVISFYIVRDSTNIAQYFWSLIPRENRLEVYYLTRRIDRTWNAFLRGQLLLSTVIFGATTFVLTLLGVSQALFLGILAGILNLIPNLGPILSGIPAVTLALVQGSTHFDMSNGLFALVVLAAYVVIQQLESNFLVPRIIGGSVHLHPAVVLLGAIIGLSTVGVLGIFLAAPTLASLRVIGGYAYRKMLSPDFQPTGVVLPPEISAIPDPRERPPTPIPSPTSAPSLPRWQEWLGRFRRRAQRLP
ncbi:MAG: AI-2E family transporter [Chloroflexota bacterium]|nr:AI-2E family transporter [Chloroflexota bacterium]